MRTQKINIDEVERFNPSIEEGLSSEQVELRHQQGLVNTTKMIAGKTWWEIIRTDVLSFFNILLLVIAGFLIYANIADGLKQTKWYNGLFFLVILFANIIIGLYQDIKAKRLMNKLKVITTPNARVIRNGQEVEITPSEIVLDDIVLLKAGEQIPSDCILVDKSASVNESMLTGESKNVVKEIGDVLYSGSYITSGTCHARVYKVGRENYIETLTEKAKAFKRNPSHILRSLKKLFRYLGIFIIILGVAVLSYYISVAIADNNWHGFVLKIRSIAGQMVAMIPSGLYLLTSMALATGVLSLYKKRANVQDFYAIEMLARSDTICVDKTGTITDGNLLVKKVDNISRLGDEEIHSIVASIIAATKDENVTGLALKEYFCRYKTFEVSKVLPFSSDNKYSGVSSTLGTTYLIGALEFMNAKNKDVLLKQTEEYTSKGYRLLALAKGEKEIVGDSYNDIVEVLAFVVLQDHVKDNAKSTFEWFQDNNVQVKVISGDNALTVSEIARIAGIRGAEKYISLEGMSIEEVKEIANDYVVFGRVTPEQKEALVIALKESKHTVAMVGDGVNDMLALKRADCSIAMNSGSLSARNVSHVVLMDDNFETMPSVVAEGRRVVNNIERTGSLFLTKTVFAFVVSITFLIASFFDGDIVYPFVTNNLYLWEIFGIGLVAFFIALEPDSKPIENGFLRQILKRALPCGAIICISVFVCYFLFMLQDQNIMYTGVHFLNIFKYESGMDRFGATAMAILVFTLVGQFILILICRPLNAYRLVVVGVSTILELAAISVFAIVGKGLVFNGHNVLWIDFTRITGENYFVAGVIVASVIILTLMVESICLYIKKYHKKEKQNEN